MIVLNLFGAPNTGKSTTAFELTAALKKRHIVAELVPEFAKVLSWSENFQALSDQNYVFAKQLHRLKMLEGKVQYAVMDSPLLISLLYRPENYYPSFDKLVVEAFHSFNNETFYLTGIKNYSSVGRHHSLSQCEQLDPQAGRILSDLGIEHTKIAQCSTEQTVDIILRKLGID